MQQPKPQTICITTVLPITMLGIDANMDPQTQAPHDYREVHVYPYFVKKGFTVEKCQTTLATQPHVSSTAKKPEVLYITGSGHGFPTIFLGHMYNVIWEATTYSSVESKGKIMHLLSCLSGANLGPDLVANGCRAFFGYDAKFVFEHTKPGIYLECDSEIDRAFAEGLTADEVYKRVIKLFDKHIDAARLACDVDRVAMLEQDRDHLVCPSVDPKFGDKHAKLA
jgi:hypothetical protein